MSGKKKARVNINSRCEFVLTERGAEVWNAQWDSIPVEFSPSSAAAGSRVVSQLWCVMEVFGPHMYLGMSSTYFDGNILEITPC